MVKLLWLVTVRQLGDEMAIGLPICRNAQVTAQSISWGHQHPHPWV